MTILLSTLNARYAHASLGLRYLLANMRDLQADTHLLEFVIGNQTRAIVERMLALRPRIIGLGIYIWNVEETTKVVAMLKVVAPDIIVILGGPEVSYETENQPIVRLADYVVTGWGEQTFPDLCKAIVNGQRPLQRIHKGIQMPLSDIQLPYRFYSTEDIAHRTLYVEASRGCPFKCEFCLSSLDKTAWSFDLELFLMEMESLYVRGARQFKFVDRTFNLKAGSCLRILQFFLGKINANPHDSVFAHFELVPDHLPDILKNCIMQFPPGTLQLEIGIQTFNPEVQSLISRRQDDLKSAENIRWLLNHSHAHLHVDLIAGLPGENMESFASGFDRLVEIGPHEIQLGIIKRLRGTPIIRHTADFGLTFDPSPPYAILATDNIDFASMQRLLRFARYWDMVANSGRFASTIKIMLGTSPFDRFMQFSDWLHAKTHATHGIALDRLASLVSEWLIAQGGTPAEIRKAIGQDYAGRLLQANGKRDKLSQGKADEQIIPRRQTLHLKALSEDQQAKP